MTRLTLPRAAYDTLRAHGEETYPNECCGALLGCPAQDGWHVVAAMRATNARGESAHNRYEIAPRELMALASEARRQGLEIAGFYHSHPDHPAHWSHTDLDEAHWVGCCYVISEVVQGQSTATQAFLLAGSTEEDKRFEPLTIELLER